VSEVLVEVFNQLIWFISTTEQKEKQTEKQIVSGVEA